MIKRSKPSSKYLSQILTALPPLYPNHRHSGNYPGSYHRRLSFVHAACRRKTISHLRRPSVELRRRRRNSISRYQHRRRIHFAPEDSGFASPRRHHRFRNSKLEVEELHLKGERRNLREESLSISSVKRACSRGGVGSDFVKVVHSDVVKSGFLFDSLVCSGLLIVYATTVKDMRSACRMFYEMPDRKLVYSWTSLISGYARIGLADEALKIFLMMLKENVNPETDTMVNVLSACSSLSTKQVEKWVNLFTKLVNDLHCDYANNVLVYLHGKCRNLEESRKAFDEISDNGKKSVVCWNAMIGAYVQNDCAVEALDVFKAMMEKYNCRPNHVTMVNVLSACAEIGDLDLGTWVHEYMKSSGQKGVLSSNVNLATALIDMYSKCGDLNRARKVFEQMSRKDVVSFNAMIIGLAVNGKGEEAVEVYHKMQKLRLRPNSGTLLGVLNACSHCGLLDKGREIFNEMMMGSNAVSPRLEHYACYIDLLARYGFVEEALGVVGSMPFEANNYVWGALVAGCVLHNRLELARTLSTNVVKVDPQNSGGYVMLSNSLAADSQWRDVVEVRRILREKGVAKQPGCSWIKIGGVVHRFIVGCDEIHSIRQLLDSLLKHMRLSEGG